MTILSLSSFHLEWTNNDVLYSMSTYWNNLKLVLQVEVKSFSGVFTVTHHRLRKEQLNLAPTETVF